jgi:hypothetical protein
MDTMIKLSEADSRIVLYAKGHSGSWGGREKDVLGKTRAILAERAGVPAWGITGHDIVAVLTELLTTLKMDKLDPKFMQSVIFGCFWNEDGSNALVNFINAVLAKIQTMPVLDMEGNVLVEIAGLKTTEESQENSTPEA